MSGIGLARCPGCGLRLLIEARCSLLWDTPPRGKVRYSCSIQAVFKHHSTVEQSQFLGSEHERHGCEAALAACHSPAKLQLTESRADAWNETRSSSTEYRRLFPQ
jgi:hypothetical protein